jgi:glutathione-specific gamma-glutamylcyclotransferase
MSGINLSEADFPKGDLWVFGYGSLIWRPGFEFIERVPARLIGEHRALCVYSFVHRGTPEKPGLVLGLDRGGSCRGIVYRLPQEGLGMAIDRVWAREMAGEVYRVRPVTVATPQGLTGAYAFVVRRGRPDYAGRLSPEAVARIIAVASGGRGTGRDYLANTVRHLEELGIEDGPLHRLHEQVEALAQQR